MPRKKQEKNMASGPDWVAIKTEYLTTSTSYRKLAAKYEVPFSTLQSRAKKENWTAARKKAQKKIMTKTVEKVTRKRAYKMDKLMQAADNMSEVIEKYSADYDNFVKDEGFKNATSIKSIAIAIKELTLVVRDLYDMPNMLDRERLELEKRKVDADTATDNQITVAMKEMEKYSD